jgi:hypothetical protein
MKYKIELIARTPSDLFRIDSVEVPVYCLYKRRCVLDKWELVYQSNNLEDLMKLGKVLKEFNTIYL